MTGEAPRFDITVALTEAAAIAWWRAAGASPRATTPPFCSTPTAPASRRYATGLGEPAGRKKMAPVGPAPKAFPL